MCVTTHKADYATFLDEDFIPFKNSKGQPNGLAELDSDGKVSMDLMPVETIIPSDDVIISSTSTVTKDIATAVLHHLCYKITVKQGGKYRIKGQLRRHVNPGTSTSLRVVFHFGEASDGSVENLGFAYVIAPLNDQTFKDFSVDLDSVPPNSTINVSITRTGTGFMSIRDISVCGKHGDLSNNISVI